MLTFSLSQLSHHIRRIQDVEKEVNSLKTRATTQDQIDNLRAEVKRISVWQLSRIPDLHAGVDRNAMQDSQSQEVADMQGFRVFRPIPH
jgi:hypothetical protein